MQTPALHIDPKSRFGPCDEARAIARMVDAACGIEVPIPMLFGRRNLGWLVGKRHSPYVWWGAGIPNLAYLNQRANSGFRWKQIFFKSMSTGASANNWFDLWACQGDPTLGSYAGAAFTSVQFTDATVGAIQHGGNVSPSFKHLTSIGASYTTAGSYVLVLYDRVLTYEACTFNANVQQALTNSLAAQRYASAGQSGLQISLTAQTAFGVTAANLTQMAYTNQAGTNGQAVPAATPALAIFPSAVVQQAGLGAQTVCPYDSANGQINLFLPLAPGDTGCRSVATYTTSAANTGTFTILLSRPLAYMILPAASVNFQTDMIYQLMNLERIYDGACLAFFAYGGPSTQTPIFNGSIDVVWG
jgi:hypothetical protein